MKRFCICLALLISACSFTQADVLIFHRWNDNRQLELRFNRVPVRLLKSTATHLAGAWNWRLTPRLKASAGFGANFLHADKELSKYNLDSSPLPLFTGALYSINPLQSLDVDLYSSISLARAGSKIRLNGVDDFSLNFWHTPLNIKIGTLKRFITVPGEWFTVLFGLSYAHETIHATAPWAEDELSGSDSFFGWEAAAAYNLSQKLSVYVGYGSLFTDPISYFFAGFRFY